jgi:hypothetical protein
MKAAFLPVHWADLEGQQRVDCLKSLHPARSILSLAVTRRLQFRRSASVDSGARGFFSVQDLPKLRFRAFS